MNPWMWVPIGIAFGTVLLAIGAWGVVQILDIMEAMDLRRAEKARMLQKAREYLKDPQTQSQGTNTPFTMPYNYPSGQTNVSGGGYTTTTSTSSNPT